jgi:hypothetical protein
MNKLANFIVEKGKSLLGKGNNGNNDGKPDERTKEEKQADLDKAMKEAKTYLDGFSGKEVNKQTIKSKLNNIKETYALKSLEPVEKGIHWGIHGEVNPTSEADSQAELSEQEKRKVIAKALNANKAQIIEQLGQNPGSRNQTRNETLSQLRTMDENSPPEFEGYILDSILEENREAFRTIKSLLAKEPPDVLMAMERGGAFLGDVLSHNNEELTSKLHKIEKGTDPNPDPNKKLRFNPEAFKSAIRTQIGSGKKSFALVDAYMGGRFAAELRDHVIKPLLTEFGQGKIKFYLFWLRETFGFEQADADKKERGLTLRKPQGTISEKSPYAQDVKTVHVNVRVVLGDDMSMVFDPNSQQPFHIFDAEGNIIKTIQPEKGETSRDTLIKLLNG